MCVCKVKLRGAVLARFGIVAAPEKPTASPNPFPRHQVNVIALTIFISLALALLFVGLFIGDRFSASGSLEQDSLLPLDGDDEDNPHNHAD